MKKPILKLIFRCDRQAECIEKNCFDAIFENSKCPYLEAERE